MKITDLQIGDWIFVNPWDDREPTYPNRVTAIQYNSWEGADYCDWVDCEVWDEIGPNDIRPIPLTKDILEYNGFKEVKGDMYFPNPKHVWIGDVKDGIIIEICIYDKPVNGVSVLTRIHTPCLENGGVNKVHNCEIEYVHQLQHAIRLCGIDKNIIVECKED